MTRALIPLLALLAATPAAANPPENLARVDMLSGWQTDQGTHMAGLRVTLQPGWKTYWRAPGDAGIPPQFDWTGSANVAGVTFHWPVPEVLHQNTMQTIGYRDSLVLPIEVYPTNQTAPMTIAGEVTLGVCEDVCVPVTLPFTADLPPDGRRNGTITAALLNQPVAGADAGVPQATCALDPMEGGLTLTATMPYPTRGTVDAVVIEAGNPQVWVSQADITMTGQTISAAVDMMHMTASSFSLDRSAVRITLLGEGFAIDVQGCAAG